MLFHVLFNYVMSFYFRIFILCFICCILLFMFIYLFILSIGLKARSFGLRISAQSHQDKAQVVSPTAQACWPAVPPVSREGRAPRLAFSFFLLQFSLSRMGHEFQAWFLFLFLLADGPFPLPPSRVWPARLGLACSLALLAWPAGHFSSCLPHAPSQHAFFFFSFFPSTI